MIRSLKLKKKKKKKDFCSPAGPPQKKLALIPGPVNRYMPRAARAGTLLELQVLYRGPFIFQDGLQILHYPIGMLVLILLQLLVFLFSPSTKKEAIEGNNA